MGHYKDVALFLARRKFGQGAEIRSCRNEAGELTYRLIVASRPVPLQEAGKGRTLREVLEAAGIKTKGGLI